jgi:hypothetical protein
MRYYVCRKTTTLAGEGQQEFEHTRKPNNSMPRLGLARLCMVRLGSTRRSLILCHRTPTKFDGSSAPGRCPAGHAPALCLPCLGLARCFFFLRTSPKYRTPSHTLATFWTTYLSGKKLNWLDQADRAKPLPFFHLPSTPFKSSLPKFVEWGSSHVCPPPRRGGSSCRIHSCSGGAE